MTIICAEEVGVKFPWRKERVMTLRRMLVHILNQRNMPKRRWFWALRGVSFSLNQGEILGVIGRNGAGKTTLLRTIAGIYPPDEGYLWVGGTISSLLSLGAGFQPELSGLENIYINGILMGFSEEEIKKHVRQIIQFSELEQFITSPMKTYSSGMIARLGFSIAVHLKRDIMLIDEILGVGDVKFREKSRKKLEELMSEGRTIIMVSHNMNSILGFSTRALWLDKGTVRAYGEPNEVVQQYLQSR